MHAERREPIDGEISVMNEKYGELLLRRVTDAEGGNIYEVINWHPVSEEEQLLKADGCELYTDINGEFFIIRLSPLAEMRLYDKMVENFLEYHNSLGEELGGIISNHTSGVPVAQALAARLMNMDIYHPIPPDLTEKGVIPCELHSRPIKYDGDGLTVLDFPSLSGYEHLGFYVVPNRGYIIRKSFDEDAIVQAAQRGYLLFIDDATTTGFINVCALHEIRKILEKNVLGHVKIAHMVLGTDIHREPALPLADEVLPSVVGIDEFCFLPAYLQEKFNLVRGSVVRSGTSLEKIFDTLRKRRYGKQYVHGQTPFSGLPGDYKYLTADSLHLLSSLHR